MICFRYEYKYQIPVVMPDPLSSDSYSGKVASRPELSPGYWKNECPTLGSWSRKSACRSRAASIAGSRDNFGVIEHQSVCDEGQIEVSCCQKMIKTPPPIGEIISDLPPSFFLLFIAKIKRSTVKIIIA